MKNLQISLPLVDGSVFPMEFDSGRELIHELVSDDWGGLPHETCSLKPRVTMGLPL